jgi:hypothetical protein
VKLESSFLLWTVIIVDVVINFIFMIDKSLFLDMMKDLKWSLWIGLVITGKLF